MCLSVCVCVFFAWQVAALRASTGFFSTEAAAGASAAATAGAAQGGSKSAAAAAASSGAAQAASKPAAVASGSDGGGGGSGRDGKSQQGDSGKSVRGGVSCVSDALHFFLHVCFAV